METAVWIAVAYLEEIMNAASLQKMEREALAAALQKMEREALAAALAIGSIGKETFRQQNIRVPENGGLFVPIPGIFSSLLQGKEPILFSEEYPGTLSLLVQKEGKADFLQHTPALSEYEFSSTDSSNFENILVKASYSFGTATLQTKDRFLISYIFMTKLALETFNGSEYIHEAESLD